MGRAEPHQLIYMPSGEEGQLLHFASELRSLEDIKLSPPMRTILQRVVAEHDCATKLREAGLRPANRLLFAGPPGCGKTTTASAIAHATGMPMAVAHPGAITGRFIGITSVHLRKLFDAALQQPMVLLIDEIDSFGARRSSDDDQAAAQEHRRTANTLLMLIEEMRDSKSILIAATNLHKALDPALWRRFDEILWFPRPTLPEATALAKSILTRYGQNPITWRWPTWLKEMSHADVERIALDAVKTVTMDKTIPIDRALRMAMDRLQARREITETRPRRRS